MSPKKNPTRKEAISAWNKFEAKTKKYLTNEKYSLDFRRALQHVLRDPVNVDLNAVAKDYGIKVEGVKFARLTEMQTRARDVYDKVDKANSKAKRQTSNFIYVNDKKEKLMQSAQSNFREFRLTAINLMFVTSENPPFINEQNEKRYETEKSKFNKLRTKELNIVATLERDRDADGKQFVGIYKLCIDHPQMDAIDAGNVISLFKKYTKKYPSRSEARAHFLKHLDSQYHIKPEQFNQAWEARKNALAADASPQPPKQKSDSAVPPPLSNSEKEAAKAPTPPNEPTQEKPQQASDPAVPKKTNAPVVPPPAFDNKKPLTQLSDAKRKELNGRLEKISTEWYDIRGLLRNYSGDEKTKKEIQAMCRDLGVDRSNLWELINKVDAGPVDLDQLEKELKRLEGLSAQLLSGDANTTKAEKQQQVAQQRQARERTVPGQQALGTPKINPPTPGATNNQNAPNPAEPNNQPSNRVVKGS